MHAKFVRLLLLVGLIAGSDAFLSSASACPMCKEANETDEVAAARPRAYMYSILFMLSMPVMVFGGIGFTFYRMVRKADREWEAAQAEAERPAGDVPPDPSEP